MSACEPEPKEALLLHRTRSAVLNVLVAISAGIAASGLALRGRERGALLWPELNAQRVAHGLLLVLIAASVIIRRALASRTALRPPETRARRFYWAHVASAAVGALAIPLGYAYAWAARPRLDAIGAFWVAALALALLAFPRAAELEDLDDSLPPHLSPAEPEP